MYDHVSTQLAESRSTVLRTRADRPAALMAHELQLARTGSPRRPRLRLRPRLRPTAPVVASRAC